MQQRKVRLLLPTQELRQLRSLLSNTCTFRDGTELLAAVANARATQHTEAKVGISTKSSTVA